MTRKNMEGNAILLPSPDERRQIFYWLKRISSLTAWRRVLQYYSEWATVTEQSVRTADDNGLGQKTSLPPSEYALILKCLAHCDEGVRRLEKGDKRVFKYDANGEFVMAARILSHWFTMLDRVRLGENRILPDTPLWEEFCNALNALADAWSECGPYIIEQKFLEDPAFVTYGQPLQKLLTTMPFPAVIAEVPDPVENIFVRTGEPTPCSGIWEPIDVPKASLMSLITRAPKPTPPFKIAGAMNYLHGGSNAPLVSVQTANDSVDISTTWRLLWADDRYSDSTIPEEEAGYRFLQPAPIVSSAPAYVTSEQIVCADSGSKAPVKGRWLVQTDLNAAIYVEEGERLPLHNGQPVRWVLAHQ